MVPILNECLTVLNNFENTGEVDPAQAKLRQEMNTAAADLDFDKAKALKEELEQLEREQRTKPPLDGLQQARKSPNGS